MNVQDQKCWEVFEYVFWDLGIAFDESDWN